MSGKSSQKSAKRTTTRNAKPTTGAERKPHKSASPKKGTAGPTGNKSRVRAQARTATNSRTKQDANAFYVVVEYDDLRISTEKPTQSMPVQVATNFDEAKDMAVDSLIALIDSFERRLWEVKQARDFASYKELVESPQ